MDGEDSEMTDMKDQVTNLPIQRTWIYSPDQNLDPNEVERMSTFEQESMQRDLEVLLIQEA